MPYTVLKISKTGDPHIDVVGEFSNEEDARAYADVAQEDDSNGEHEYLVESPPSVAKKMRPPLWPSRSHHGSARSYYQ